MAPPRGCASASAGSRNARIRINQRIGNSPEASLSQGELRWKGAHHSTDRLTIGIDSTIFNCMVELQPSAPQRDTVFHALGDSTRRQMLRELADGERTVSQLAQPFAMSLAAASKHIQALEKAGLIAREVRGRTH